MVAINLNPYQGLKLGLPTKLEVSAALQST